MILTCTFDSAHPIVCAMNKYFRNHKKYDVQKVESVVYDLQVRGVTKRKKPNVEEEQTMNE